MTTRKLLIFAAVLLTFAGCSDNNSNLEPLFDYQHRIENILEQKVQAVPVELPRFPERRQLLLKTQEIKINWSQFFSLQQCPELQVLLAERNNQLGKMQEAATRLKYETQLLILFESCMQDHNGIDSESERALIANIELKRGQYPRVLWNHTWASDYWQSLFSYAGSRQQNVSRGQLESLVNDLQSLRLSSDKSQDADWTGWYARFSRLEKNSAALGALIYESRQHINTMQNLNDLLESKLPRLCPDQRAGLKAQYLVNVLNRFYLGKLQKRQADLDVALRLLGDETAAWLEVDPKLDVSKEFSQWYRLTLDNSSDVSLRKSLRDELKRHVKFWQRLSELCHIDVINNNT